MSTLSIPGNLWDAEKEVTTALCCHVNYHFTESITLFSLELETACVSTLDPDKGATTSLFGTIYKTFTTDGLYSTATQVTIVSRGLHVHQPYEIHWQKSDLSTLSPRPTSNVNPDMYDWTWVSDGSTLSRTDDPRATSTVATTSANYYGDGDGDRQNNSSGGAIAVIPIVSTVVSLVILAVLLCCAGLWVHYSRKNKRDQKRKDRERAEIEIQRYVWGTTSQQNAVAAQPASQVVGGEGQQQQEGEQRKEETVGKAVQERTDNDADNTEMRPAQD